ncbi:hypothetical protein [Luteococcus peritonei]|uniref:Uncharacterized protein n=1 Tax=Luteococcus peritonei TaxID=88874 RepID=A0ABW4RY42_9ACTN
MTAGQPAGMAGFVDLEAVVGPVVATVAPVDRWRRFTLPGAFGSVPGPAGPAPAAPAVRDGVTDC